MRYVMRLGQQIENLIVMLALISLFLIMCIVTVDVGLRYFFNSPLAWSYEFISMYLMVALFFFMISNTQDANAHISVDILHYKMSPSLRRICYIISYLLAIVIFALILWTSLQETWISFKNKAAADSLIPWPIWLSWLPVPIGSLAIIIRLLNLVVRHFQSLRAGVGRYPLPKLSGYEGE